MLKINFNKIIPYLSILFLVSSCSSTSAVRLLKAKSTNLSYNLSSLNEEYFTSKEKADSFELKFNEAYLNKFDDGVSNLAISPYSVFMSLGMLYETANNNSAKEILDALSMTENELRNFSSFSYRLSNKEKYSSNDNKLILREKLLNSFWINEGFNPKEEALNNLANYYFTDSYEAQFFTNNKQANKDLTKYISDETYKFLKPDLNISEYAKIVLMNLLYLKTAWGNLDLNLTLDEFEFLNSDLSTTKKKFIVGKYQTGRMLEKDSYRAFYNESDSGYRLYFIVPNINQKLKDVYNYQIINEIRSYDYSSANNENVAYLTKCIFPSFSAESNNDIKDLMRESFNIKECMDKDLADLSKISDTKLYVNDYKHIAKLNVDEKGIEGAAVTVISGDATSAGRGENIIYETFFVDRSFAYILEDPYQNILFSGVVNTI